MLRRYLIMAGSVAMTGVAGIVQAVELGGLETTAGTAGIDGGTTDPTTTVANLIGWALSFVGVIFLILTIYGGFLWMTSAGNEEQIGKAQKTIVAGVIGLVIILSAYAITRYVGGAFGV